MIGGRGLSSPIDECELANRGRRPTWHSHDGCRVSLALCYSLPTSTPRIKRPSLLRLHLRMLLFFLQLRRLRYPIIPHLDVSDFLIPKPVRILRVFLGQKARIDVFEAPEGAKGFPDGLVSFVPGIWHEFFRYEMEHALFVAEAGLSEAQPDAQVRLALLARVLSGHHFELGDVRFDPFFVKFHISRHWV